jgi:hypothetical protein
MLEPLKKEEKMRQSKTNSMFRLESSMGGWFKPIQKKSSVARRSSLVQDSSNGSSMNLPNVMLGDFDTCSDVETGNKNFEIKLPTVTTEVSKGSRGIDDDNNIKIPEDQKDTSALSPSGSICALPVKKISDNLSSILSDALPKDFSDKFPQNQGVSPTRDRRGKESGKGIDRFRGKKNQPRTVYSLDFNVPSNIPGKTTEDASPAAYNGPSSDQDTASEDESIKKRVEPRNIAETANKSKAEDEKTDCASIDQNRSTEEDHVSSAILDEKSLSSEFYKEKDDCQARQKLDLSTKTVLKLLELLKTNKIEVFFEDLETMKKLLSVYKTNNRKIKAENLEKLNEIELKISGFLNSIKLLKEKMDIDGTLKSSPFLLFPNDLKSREEIIVSANEAIYLMLVLEKLYSSIDCILTNKLEVKKSLKRIISSFKDDYIKKLNLNTFEVLFDQKIMGGLFNPIKEQKKIFDCLECKTLNESNNELLTDIVKYNKNIKCINKYDLIKFYEKLQYIN